MGSYLVGQNREKQQIGYCARPRDLRPVVFPGVPLTANSCVAVKAPSPNAVGYVIWGLVNFGE